MSRKYNKNDENLPFDAKKFNQFTSDPDNVEPQPAPGKAVAGEDVEADKILALLIESSTKIRSAAGRRIIYAPPVIAYGEAPIISAGNITLIQGKSGSHKSRIAENICSVMISPGGIENSLGMERKAIGTNVIIYIDTERNTKEDVPAAIQRIRRGAGMDELSANDENLLFVTSVKEIDRTARKEAVKAYIEHVTGKVSAIHAEYRLILVIDVITDLVSSFNNDVEAMQLYDYLNVLCEQHNVAILAVLHENPGTEKARGHVGTEGQNKASTQIRIAPDGENNLIRITFVKCRNAARPAPIFAEYCHQIRGLKLVDSDQAAKLRDKRLKATTGEILESIGRFFDTRLETPQGILLEHLKTELGVADRWARTKLQEVVAGKLEVINAAGESCQVMTRKEGRLLLFSLVKDVFNG